MADWTDAQKVRGLLVDDGWVSPDTYDTCFAPIIRGSAVYLFLLYERHDYQRAIVAYVGMSSKLKQRLSCHDVMAELDAPEYWTMRWFKPSRANELRAIERKYIAKFDPPWNIIGRPRGLSAP